MAGRYLPPPPVPTRKRLFAHVLMVDLACPHCGRLHAATRKPASRKLRIRASREWKDGYDYVRGVFTCRACQREYHVGVVLYPRPSGNPRTRLKDTRPTLEEAVELREQASHQATHFPGDAHGNLLAGLGEVEGGSPEAGRGDRAATGRLLAGMGHREETPDGE